MSQRSFDPVAPRPRRILVVNPFGVGDVLFTTPVVRALKAHFPGCFLGYLCSRRSAPLLRHNPHIDALFCFSRGDYKDIKKKSPAAGLKFLGQAIGEIRAQRFDLAVDLSLASQYSVLFWLLGIRQRWGFDYKNRGRMLTHKIPCVGFTRRHVVDYYGDLLRQLGVRQFERRLELALSRESREWADSFLREHEVGTAQRVIGISAFGGASWGPQAGRKQWPAERFAAAVRKLRAGQQTVVLLFGVGSERADCDRLAVMLSGLRVINAAGKTSLEQLAALISRCDILLANDGGAAHIAAARDVKCVTIFGPVDEKVYGPLTASCGQRAVSAPALSCRPCYRRFKTPACDSGRCLEQVSVEAVVDTAQQLLNQSAPVGRSKDVCLA